VVKFENHTVVTHMLVEGIHFDLSYVPLKHLGKSDHGQSVDVYAMNAVKTPPRFHRHLKPLSSGSRRRIVRRNPACKANVDLIGGDTTASNTGLVISVTALGEQER
jgi:thiamine-monophosphate kinase